MGNRHVHLGALLYARFDSGSALIRTRRRGGGRASAYRSMTKGAAKGRATGRHGKSPLRRSSGSGLRSVEVEAKSQRSRSPQDARVPPSVPPPVGTATVMRNVWMVIFAIIVVLAHTRWRHDTVPDKPLSTATRERECPVSFASPGRPHPQPLPDAGRGVSLSKWGLVARSWPAGSCVTLPGSVPQTPLSS